MIGFPVGLIYANAGEWLLHKYVLHGRGRRSKNFWSFHLAEHHRASSLLGGRDPAYEHLRLEWNAQTKELAALVGAAVAHIPLFPVAPFFTSAVWMSIGGYYVVHRKAHLDPEWARAHLPWHVDHHMGPDPDANWCVTWPLWDHVMGTRSPWVGTSADPVSAAAGG